MKQIKTFLPILMLSLCLLSCNNEELEEQNNQEFIEYNIDGEESVLILTDIHASFNLNGENPVLDIYTLQIDNNNCFRIMVISNNSNFLGSYSNSYSYFYPYEFDIGFMLDDFSWFFCPDMFDIHANVDIIVNVNSIGEIDEFIDINFNGSYEDFDGNNHTIDGVVHVLRDE